MKLLAEMMHGRQMASRISEAECLCSLCIGVDELTYASAPAQQLPAQRAQTVLTALQCLAMPCSALQCLAVPCSALQCLAVPCSLAAFPRVSSRLECLPGLQ